MNAKLIFTYSLYQKKSNMKKTTSLTRFAIAVIAWLLLGTGSFVLNSCSGCNNPNQSKDTTTTVSTDSSAGTMMDSGTSNPMIDTTGKDTGKDVTGGKDKKP